MIMSSGDRTGTSRGREPQAESEQAQGASGKRRLSAMAAVVALATVAGALGGALATAGFGHFAGADKTASNNLVLEASVARIDADLLALKASVEHTSKLGMSQFNKTSDRLDKVEKAQAEPAAKLAKLSDAVDKLRAAPAAPVPVAAASVAAKDVTGSIAPPATAAAAPVPLPVPKPEVARLPTVDGWVLRDVANGGALIEGRQGNFRSLCRRSRPGPRPGRRDPQAGRPLGRRHQQGPDRRALNSAGMIAHLSPHPPSPEGGLRRTSARRDRSSPAAVFRLFS